MNTRFIFICFPPPFLPIILHVFSQGIKLVISWISVQERISEEICCQCFNYRVRVREFSYFQAPPAPPMFFFFTQQKQKQQVKVNKNTVGLSKGCVFLFRIGSRGECVEIRTSARERFVLTLYHTQQQQQQLMRRSE